jgi:type III secretion system YseE family protein
MTKALEEGLLKIDFDDLLQFKDKLELALFDCRKRLSKGAGPQHYLQWQIEYRALAAAMTILNALEGK